MTRIAFDDQKPSIYKGRGYPGEAAAWRNLISRYPNLKRGNFRLWVRHLVELSVDNDIRCGRGVLPDDPDGFETRKEYLEYKIQEATAYLHFNPDAFVVEKHRGRIWIFEIEDTCSLRHNPIKLGRIADTSEVLAEMGIDLTLIVVDRYGNLEHSICLQAHFNRICAAAVEENDLLAREIIAPLFSSENNALTGKAANRYRCAPNLENFCRRNTELC